MKPDVHYIQTAENIDCSELEHDEGDIELGIAELAGYIEVVEQDIQVGHTGYSLVAAEVANEGFHAVDCIGHSFVVGEVEAVDYTARDLGEDMHDETVAADAWEVEQIA